MKTKFMFATDLHGSETCWRKFLNTAKIHDLDALVMSGDMTGKIMIPIVQRKDGKWDARLLDTDYVLEDKDLPDFEKKCRMICYLPYRTTPEEVTKISESEKYREDLFEELEKKIVSYWLTLIPEKVPKKCRVIISPGNDDKLGIDEVIKKCSDVTFGEQEVVSLDADHEVACCGWSNPTPFDSPRECSEEELERKLEGTVSKIKNMGTAVFCFHVPPFDSGIDTAPKVDENLKPVVVSGKVMEIPAGSTAVRKIITKYQPLLGLHGHIHESPGMYKIGRTECLNPGSEYSEGIFKGFLVEIDGEKISKLQRIEG
jgi:Icc-related predicted phosphoesterase